MRSSPGDPHHEPTPVPHPGLVVPASKEGAKSNASPAAAIQGWHQQRADTPLMSRERMAMTQKCPSRNARRKLCSGFIAEKVKRNKKINK